MITIDRTSSTSVHDQLLEQLRFQIASGHYKLDETLPSTRKLGEQLGLSFHTVRKVYQELEREGVLVSRIGSGYRVKERAPLGKGERMERGAAIVQEALQRLIGLGLDDGEIDYLFQEQLSLIEGAAGTVKLVFAAPYQEMADQCAEQITLVLQQTVEPAVLAQLDRHRDADYVFARFADVQRVMEKAPKADVLGVVAFLGGGALDRVSRLLDRETLGLVTRYPDAIAPLSAELRALTAFAGQIMAGTVDQDARYLEQMLRQVDFLLYTPACRRRLLAYLKDHHQHAQVGTVVSRESLERVREAVPG